MGKSHTISHASQWIIVLLAHLIVAIIIAFVYVKSGQMLNHKTVGAIIWILRALWNAIYQKWNVTVVIIITLNVNQRAFMKLL